MIRRLLLSTLLAGSMLTSGCYMVNMQVESAQPVLLNAAPAKGKNFFQREERVMYFMWGLVNTNPRVVEDLTREFKTGPITSYNVYTEEDAVGVITGLITLGIVSSRIVRVEGNK
ncbi:MAG: hypothetical protein ACLGIN_12960 [Candidatus Sericytochromatia bacterium]